ncbi:MAG: DUF4864 domain-containing protein [Anaerolineae bacterium]|nr:DUF4864 domain-containing protein [Anaerolineae bacterium]
MTCWCESGPDLSPQEVVRIQIEAMRRNHELGNNRGLAIVYDFASPDNKAHTGPLERFVQMVMNPLYHPLLECQQVQFGLLQVGGTQAQQQVLIVTPEGQLLGYLFILSRQPNPPCKDWWMTDSVIRLF